MHSVKIWQFKNRDAHPNCWTIVLFVMRQFLNKNRFNFFIDIKIGSYDSLLLHCVGGHTGQDTQIQQLVD